MNLEDCPDLECYKFQYNKKTGEITLYNFLTEKWVSFPKESFVPLVENLLRAIKRAEE